MVPKISDRKAPVITREALIDHALRLADEEGPDAVTIRRVAQDFSVTPMALYWHVKNKDELLAAMGDALFDQLEVPEAGGPWPDQIRGIMAALLAALRVHPASVELALPRILACPKGQALTERTLDVLREAGFSPQDSALLARTALQTIMMLISGEPGAERTMPREQREAALAHKRLAVSSLPADRFPRLVECATALFECDDVPGYYAAGLDVFIGGVTSLAPERAGAARG